MRRVAPGFLVGLACTLSAFAQGGAIAVKEVATPNLGEAYAGQAAVADNASTAYLNPAGMTRLEGSETLIGGQLAALGVRFQPNSFSTMKGSDGGDIREYALLPGTYVVRRLTDRFRVGFSFNAPIGLSLDYSEDWVGRYLSRHISMAILEFHPSVGVRVNRWLSLGFGAAIQRASLTQKQAGNNSLFVSGYPDGLIHASHHDWGFGTQYGALIEPSRRTRIGVTYRSYIKYVMQGTIEMEGVTTALATRLARNGKSDNRMRMPQAADVSLYHDVTDRFALLTDVGWTAWRHFGEKTYTLPSGAKNTVHRKWRDTFRIGLGMRRKLNDRHMLQAGVSYDSNPVSYWDRTPDLPVDRQIRYATGWQYIWRPGLILGFAVSYADLGAARLDTPYNPLQGRLAGQYELARLPFVSLTMQFK